MKSIYKKGFSVFLGILIIGSLVYLNVGSTRAASAITGDLDAVWYDANGDWAMNAGEGIPGIDIYLDNSGIVSATTAADGSFSDIFASVDPLLDWDGDHYLTFKADGFKTVTYNVSNLAGATALAGGSVKMLLQESIYGKVVGNDGKPLAGIKVEALVYGTGTVAQDVLAVDAVAITDQYGNYVLKGLAAGTYDIRASKGEYVAQLLTGVKVIYGQTTDNVNFTMVPNYGTIIGHVTDGATALQGAVVSIPGLGLSAVTDASGQYVLTGVMPGSYTLICEIDGYEIGVLYYKDTGSAFSSNPADYSPFVLPGPAVTPTSADFNLDPEPITPVDGYVSGRVMDAEGNPLECAYVEIPGLQLARCTDKGGYYIFEDVPNGEYDVVAQDLDPNTEVLEHKTVKARVEVVPGVNEVEDFTLPENPGFIVGQIIDKDNLPVNGVSVNVPNSTISSLTDLNGWYALQNVNVERYTIYDYVTETIQYYVSDVVVRATSSDYGASTLVVEPIPANGAYDNIYNLNIIKKTGVIKGQLFEIGTGQPIEEARVRAYGREAITDSSGVYEFVQVPVGSYTVVAGEGPAQTYTETTYDFVVENGVPVSPSMQTMLNFNLPAATASLYGYVSGVLYEDIDGSSDFGEGEGRSGISVEIPGYPIVVSDDYGFYMAWADAGNHNQVVYGGDYEWQSLGGTTFTSNLEDYGNDVELTRRTGDLVGRVTENGEPVESANLWVPQYDNVWTEGDASLVEVDSDFYGNYAFAGTNSLDKGRHLLVVQRWDDSNMSYEFDFSFVTIASTVTKNISMIRETGRVEGYAWDDLNSNDTYDVGEPYLPDVQISLSKVYSTTSDSTGYYTILDVPVTLDRDTAHPTPAYEINRYTGIAYLTGYSTETFVSAPIAADGDIYDHTSTSTVEYVDCNNIEVFEDISSTDITSGIDYPLDKASPLPVNGSVSGYVDLNLNLIEAEAEVWIESTNMNTWSDIEGFWIILDATPGNYAIQAGKPNYVSQIHPNVPIIEGFENSTIDFSLEKDGMIRGHVYEDVDHSGTYSALVDVPVSGALVSIANLQTLTDSNGEYIIDGIYANAPYNGYTVTATKQNYSLEVQYDVEVFHGGPTTVLGDFLLEKDQGFIIGKVSDHSTMDGLVGISVLAMDDFIATNTLSALTDDAGYYVLAANMGTYTLQAPEEPNATNYVTKEIYNVFHSGYAITRENFVLWDETTMPDNNLFGIVYRDIDDSSTYDDGEETGGIEVSIPGLDMTVMSASSLTDPDGIPSNGDEYNFIFMDVPDNPGYTYTLTAKMAIPGTSPTQYVMEYITGTSPGATQWEIGLEWPPATPYDSWIEGIVFWDENLNGIVDENERLPEINVFVPGSSPTNIPGDAFLTSVTDSTGYYIINNVPSRINDVAVVCTVIAQEPDPSADYEVGIQRNIPVQSGLGDWIDFPLNRTTSYTSAYLFGEVYFDENDNDAYDVDDTPSTEGILNASIQANGYSTSTDSFGFYIFDGLVANQTYLVEVSANGYEVHSEYETADLGYNGNINFPMTKQANSISGFVFEDVNENGFLDAADKIINAKIVAVKTGGGTYEAYTDATGFYFLPNLPVGDYDIVCEQVYVPPELPEYQDWTYLGNPVTITAGAAASVDIPMARYYVDVDGTVTDSDTLLPIANVTVAWYSPDDFVTPRFVAMTDISGEWSTSSNAEEDNWNHTDLDGDSVVDDNEVGAPVGTWYVVFSASGYDTLSKWIVLDWNDVPGPITVDVELTETTGGTIEGTVTNAVTLANIENATIRATNQTTLDIYATQSLVDGTYELIVPEGTYDISCTKLGFADEDVVNIIVVSSSTVTQDFAMTPTGGFTDITVNVDDIVPNPLDDVLVTVWYQDPTSNLFTLIEDGTTVLGTVTFTDVPVAADGQYYVCASDNVNDRIMETEEVELEDGVPETVNFTLVDGTSSEINLGGATSQWYMLSLPVHVRDDTFWPALLYASGIDETGWDMIASWDGVAYDYYDTTLLHSTQFWLARDPSLGYDPGFWIHMEAGTHDLKVVGEDATSRVMTLTGGQWTLMGYALLADANPIVNAIDQNPTDSINLMWTYDIPPSAAELYDPLGRFTPNGFETLDTWHAYWIFVDVDCTLTITSP